MFKMVSGKKYKALMQCKDKLEKANREIAKLWKTITQQSSRIEEELNGKSTRR